VNTFPNKNWKKVISGNLITELQTTIGTLDKGTKGFSGSGQSAIPCKVVYGTFEFDVVKYNTNQALDVIFINSPKNESGQKYTNEFSCKYYLLDNYLDDFHLGIEVHGNFFHCNPNFEKQNSRKTKIIGKDKAKHTYIKNYIGFEVLYLWEEDIIKNIKACELLVKKYIENQKSV
jgi:very-short-patch-repair endonuclease